MIQRHYDDEAIMSMLDAVPPAADVHFGHCPACSEKMDSFRMVADALRDSATWDQRPVDETPSRSTISLLRGFAVSMETEDARAERFVDGLLESPRESWMSRLAAHRQSWNAGVVRRLLAVMPRALDTMPADAVEIAALAVAVAEELDTASNRPDTIARLRGAAWRERAYALLYVGRYAEADVACTRADEEFSVCAVDEYDRARVGIVRALIDRLRERPASALAAAKASEATFAFFDDQSRTAAAALSQVHVLYSLHRFEEAHGILLGLERRLSRSGDIAAHAGVLANLGFCAGKLGRIEEAIGHHEMAAVLMEDLENHTEVVRQRWNVASLLASQGRFDVALARFGDVRREFERIGMTMPAVLAGLDMAEIYLFRGETTEVEEICRDAMRSFEIAGIENSAQALTALAFLQEAVQNRKARPELARHVNDYLRRLPDEPQLLFAPPPD